MPARGDRHISQGGARFLVRAEGSCGSLPKIRHDLSTAAIDRHCRVECGGAPSPKNRHGRRRLLVEIIPGGRSPDACMTCIQSSTRPGSGTALLVSAHARPGSLAGGRSRNGSWQLPPLPSPWARMVESLFQG